MNKLTWGDLFEYIGKSDKTCPAGNETPVLEEFCDRYGLPYYVIKAFLASFGGHCDCEILMNSTNHLKDKDFIGVINVDWSDYCAKPKSNKP